MDLLPPGNTPFPNVDNDRRDFPNQWASDVWPSIWPRLVHIYSTTAARDADLAGLSATDVAFAWIKTSNSLTAWTGTAWNDAKGSTDTGWITATLNTGWTNASGITTQYRRFNGAVEVRGNVVRGSGAVSAFLTLPAGYRPSTTVPLGSHYTDAGVGYELFAASTGTVGFASSGYVTGSTGVGTAHPVGGSFLL